MGSGKHFTLLGSSKKMKNLQSLAAIIALLCANGTADAHTEQAILHLRSQLDEQQRNVASLQSEVSSLLQDISDERASAVAAKGISLDINFPGQVLPSGTDQGKNSTTETSVGALESSAPIPIMVVKPSSVADVEDALTQVIEQEAAFSGQSRAEASVPMSDSVRSPAEIIDNAIARINHLEAEKIHYDYDNANIRNNYA